MMETGTKPPPQLLKNQKKSERRESSSITSQKIVPQGLHSHILMTGRGGGVRSDFFGSKILAKTDFFGSMKDAGIILGCEKRNRGFFWVC